MDTPTDKTAAVHLAVLADTNPAGDEQLCAVLTYDGSGRAHLHPVTAATSTHLLGRGPREFRTVGPVSSLSVEESSCRNVAGGVAVSEENDRGVCVKVVYGNFDVASCGDVNQPVEDAIAPADGQVEIAKVSYHGSAGSSSPTFLETLAPEVAILTVGSNSYGHPAPEVISRWEAAGMTLFQTGTPDSEPDDGDVTVTAFSDGSFSAHGETGDAYTSDGVVEGATPDPQQLAPGCDDAPAGRFDDVSGTHQAGIDLHRLVGGD